MVQDHQKKGEYKMDNLEVNTKNWKSLIKPAKLDVKLSDDKTIAKVIITFGREIIIIIRLL